MVEDLTSRRSVAAASGTALGAGRVHRKRFRRIASAKPRPDETPEESVMRLRALLHVVAAGVWETGDNSWIDSLFERAEALP